MEQEVQAIVLLSGGQDSTTCLYWAIREFGRVEAVAFDYGQKHAVELQQAMTVANLAGVKLTILDVKGTLTGGALVNHEQDVSSASHLDENLPASFTAGRNILFLTIAGALAKEKGVDNLVTGICQTDYSGYPDCRNNFAKAMRNALALGLDSERLEIHTPLMWLTKAETWKLAGELGVVDIIVEHTHTDYNGDRTQRNDWGYGKLDNPASQIRKEGYEEAVANGWI